MSRQRPAFSSSARLPGHCQSTWVPLCLITPNPVQWQKVRYIVTKPRPTTKQNARSRRYKQERNVSHGAVFIGSMIILRNTQTYQPWIEALATAINENDIDAFEACYARPVLFPLFFFLILLAFSRLRYTFRQSVCLYIIPPSKISGIFHPHRQALYGCLSDPSYPSWHEPDKLERQPRWLTSTISSVGKAFTWPLSAFPRVSVLSSEPMLSVLLLPSPSRSSITKSMGILPLRHEIYRLQKLSQSSWT